MGTAPLHSQDSGLFSAHFRRNPVPGSGRWGSQEQPQWPPPQPHSKATTPGTPQCAPIPRSLHILKSQNSGREHSHSIPGPTLQPPRHHAHTEPRLALSCQFAGAPIEQGIKRPVIRGALAAVPCPPRRGGAGRLRPSREGAPLACTSPHLCFAVCARRLNLGTPRTAEHEIWRLRGAAPASPLTAAGIRGCRKRSYLAAGVRPGLTGASFPRWLLSAHVAAEPLS